MPIRIKCAERREEHSRREPLSNYTDPIDLKEIVDKNWRLFEADFQRVKTEVKSKKDFLEHLARLNEIRNEVAHPVRGGLTDDDLKFAQWMRKVVETFTAEMEG